MCGNDEERGCVWAICGNDECVVVGGAVVGAGVAMNDDGGI